MKARRLEEALDECLAAYLEGGRSVEESLSLYPALRDKLEPLLKTAIELADALNASPPSYVQESGRDRFLASAAVRRRALAITKNLRSRERLMTRLFRGRRWALVVPALGALAVAAIVGATALDRSSRPGDAPESGSSEELPPAASDLRQAQQRLWAHANRGTDVSLDMIRDLSRTTTRLESQVKDFSALDGDSRLELERTIADQYVLLHLIVETQRAAVAPEAEEALGLTEAIAAEWGVDLPEIADDGDGAQPSPLVSPTPAPSPTGSPAPSEAPSATPSAQPSATVAP